MEYNIPKRLYRANSFIKIVVMGQCPSGKTDLCKRFVKRESTSATIGWNCYTSRFTQGHEEFFVEIWDTPGHESYMLFNKKYIKKAKFNGIVFVYDITQERSFSQTQKLIECIKPELHDCEIIIVGNKCDLEHRREVSIRRGANLAWELDAKFFEVSAKTRINVHEAFNSLLRDVIARMDGKKETIPEQIAQDPYASFLFEKALQDGKEKDRSIRVNIVGNFRQGKTTLTRRLLGQEVKGIKSTDGIAVEHYKCERGKNGKLRYTKADDVHKSEFVKRLVSGAVSEKNKTIEQPTQSLTESNVLRQENKPTVQEHSANYDDTGNFQDNLITEQTQSLTESNVLRQENRPTVQEHSANYDDAGDFQDNLITKQTQSLTESNVLRPENKPMVQEHSANYDDAGDFQDNLITEVKTTSMNIQQGKPRSINAASQYCNSQQFRHRRAKDERTQTFPPKGKKTANEAFNKISILSTEEKEAFVKSLKTNQASLQSEGHNVFDIWDFGGQHIFYATHAIFHSKRAIYLLVFDLTLDLNQCISDEQYQTESENRNMKYFMQFWLSSIHSFVGSADGTLPKVILVGTHKDKLKVKKHEKERYIKAYFENIRQMFDGTNLSHHIHSDDFAVDNTDAKDPSLNSLREAIIRLGNEQSETNEIPLKWIQLEKSLLERKHLKLISIKFVLAIDSGNEFPLGDIEQVKLFLRYHHEKGTFVYFDEEPISQYVVLDPQYLIDAFKCIITSERFCTNDPEIRPLWKMLLSEGRLEKQLIDLQWGKPKSVIEMFMENKEILLSFLVKHHIISEAATYDENTKQSTGLGWFVVPSLLRDNSSRTEIREFLNGKNSTTLRYVLFFDNSTIVSTIYHRLVSATLGKWPIAKAGKKTLIFKDMCIVRLNFDHAGIAEMKYNSIEMTVCRLCPTLDVNDEQADSFRRFLESVIVHEFQKLLSTEATKNYPYTIMFRCNHDSHGANGSEHLISMDDMRSGKVVPCPDLMTHEINVEMANKEWFQDNKKIAAIPDNQLTDKLLSSISQCFGEHWQLLGLELGLTQVQIDHIIEDHPRSAVMRIYTMLQKWCSKNASKASLKCLIETVYLCPHVHVDWDKLRKVIDKLNSDV
ncbi:uncharacterized protein LOC123535269 [Mercenaria mercenaria]|uniref:uncharacterized protein LOC123535269 n=1 Tax=Mercenaria mercenaria TaxID=6596 RepID=UPI00234ED00D|nr:uncharacterized protein LOC123535269 [Mercenaria mercenaria]